MLWLLTLPLLLALVLVWALHHGKLKPGRLQTWWDENMSLTVPGKPEAEPDTGEAAQPQVWHGRARVQAPLPPQPQPEAPPQARAEPPHPVAMPVAAERMPPPPVTLPVSERQSEPELLSLPQRVPPHYTHKPRPAPVVQDSALPVIGLAEVQRNLQSDVQRREKLAASERRERRLQPHKEPALPFIDPDEVRHSLQQLHGKREQAPPPPKPVVVLQPTPVMRKPAPASYLDEQTRQRNAEALFGAGSRFAGAVTAPAKAAMPVPPAIAMPAAAITQPETVMPANAELMARAGNETSVEDEACSAMPEAQGGAEDDAAIGAAGWPELAEPVAAELAVMATVPTAVIDEIVAAPVASPVAAVAVSPAIVAVPPEVSAPPSPAPRNQQDADIVWHLLEDEDSPAEAPPAATPSPLVWQLIDEPQAAATPVPQPAPVATTLAAVVPPKAHAMPVVYGDACLPSLSLLRPPETDKAVQSEDYLIERGILIEEKCAEFKVRVTVADAYAGPVITRYEVEPAMGVRGSQVVNLAKDLSRALGVASIRMVETIPGKTCMGLELPNPKRQMIRLSEVFGADVFTQSTSKLTLALGQDISGAPVVMDLAKAPHLLVAGTTGSGKSVGVNAMILSMLYKATPDEVRFIMIDPKMLELSVYNDIPHLLAPVVTDMKLAANALNWCVGEMEKRYRLMSHLGVRNLAGYNDKVRAAEARGQRLSNPFSLTPDTPEPLATLPFIVVVVDEFADLMMVAGKKIEELIARLAQKARAAGIHLILATQRPSVDVITGLIKANIPTRIAFQVSSKIDSRTILDQMGAESLLGQGDMLFLPPGTGYPQRVHGAFVTDEEVHAVVEDLKQWGEPDYIEGLLTGESVADDEQADAKGRAGAANEIDPLYDEAVEIVLRTRKASISSVQRQLRIGYNRAARLIEDMEAAGIVSSMENNGNRTVLVPQRDF